MRKRNEVSRAGRAAVRPIPGLGDRLYAARRKASKPGSELSQGQAGVVVGKTGVAVGRWELGKLEPSLMDLVGLAKLYGVDPADLAFGTGEERAALVANYEPPPTPVETTVAGRAAKDLQAVKQQAGQAKPRPQRRAGS